MSDTAVFPWSRTLRPDVLDPTPTCFGRCFSLPAIRIPVNANNRTRLREMRARELEEWKKAGLNEAQDWEPTTSDRSMADHEAGIALLVLATAALISIVDNTTLLNLWYAGSGWVQRAFEMALR
jgi:hypothetical protein